MSPVKFNWAVFSRVYTVCTIIHTYTHRLKKPHSFKLKTPLNYKSIDNTVNKNDLNLQCCKTIVHYYLCHFYKHHLYTTHCLTTTTKYLVLSNIPNRNRYLFISRIKILNYSIWKFS